MANPTVPSKEQMLDYSGLYLKVDGLVNSAGTAALDASPQSNIADLAAAALSTSDTYTDAAVNAQLDLIINKVNAILTALEDAGIFADS